MASNRLFQEEVRLSTELRVSRIKAEIEKGYVVCVQGPSGSGKSSTMRSLAKDLTSKGQAVAHLDMRYIHGVTDFHKQLARTLYSGSSSRDLELGLNRGETTLLLDEYWAGRAIATPVISYALGTGNRLVTVAGLPPNISQLLVYETAKN